MVSGQPLDCFRLEDDLRQSRQENAGAQLRDLISLAYFQANQKNFGLAAETSSQFFGRAREMANQAQDATSRKALEDLLALSFARFKISNMLKPMARNETTPNKGNRAITALRSSGSRIGPMGNGYLISPAACGLVFGRHGCGPDAIIFLP